MSKLRSVNTSIWTDVWFEELNSSMKLLFIYLITNEKTNMLGVYEISLKKISFETSLPIETIKKSFDFFQESNKIKYQNNRVVLLNYLKHQNYNENMKKSAIDCYNELPLDLKIEGVCTLERNSDGFETLCNGFGMVRKIEYEIEYEEEEENKILLGESVLIPDNFKNLKNPSLFEETQKSLNNTPKVLDITKSKLDDFKDKTVEEIFSLYTKDKKDIVLNVALWNSFAKKYSKSEVYKITGERKKKLNLRLTSEDFSMDKILESAKSQSFAMENSWFNFDFIIANETNYIKLLEKKYLNNEPKESNKGNFTI